MSWKRSSRRVFYLITAVAAGSGLIYVLSIAGNGMKGPLENLMVQTTEAVHDVEQHAILEQREDKRSDKLEWFKPMIENVEKLKHPTTMLFGASDSYSKESFESIINLEDSLKTTFPLIHIYAAWGSKEDEKFPNLEVKTILELGSVPVITWEPWLSDFEETEYPGIPKSDKREKGCLGEIAKGIYDKYIKEWALEAKAIGKPVMLRVGHEMNDPYRYPWGPQNNKPEEFVAAWKHIHSVFDKVGANNVLWIWSPHLSYGYFDAFYPGDKYVDYVGVGVLNYGTSVNWSKWWTFQEIFGNYYAEISKYKKPIMITEFGSLSIGGNRAKWFDNAFLLLQTKFKAVKSILFFHYSSDNTITDKALDWQFKDDTGSLKIIRKNIKQFNHVASQK